MPSTISPNSTTNGAAVQAWTDIASGSQVIVSAINVKGKRAIRFSVALARRSGSQFSVGPIVRFEGSTRDSGNTDWKVLTAYQMAVGASIANTTLTAAVLAGATTFPVAAGTNIGAGDLLYLGDPSSANWELSRVRSIASLTVTPEEAVTFAHASGSAVTDQAETFTIAFGCETLSRVRVVVDNVAGGQTVAVEIHSATYDSDNAT